MAVRRTYYRDRWNEKKVCGLSELQAINILNGFHVKDYIAIKEREYAENERRKAERDQDT